jgi:hypothetical protein
MLEGGLADSSHSCAAPPPQIKSYLNSLTNETSTISTDVNVQEIGILFDYEIQHGDGVDWGDPDEEKGWISQGLDKAGEFFGGLFGGGKEEEAEEFNQDGKVIVGAGDGGPLLQLEQFMVDQIWSKMLEDDKMTWTQNTVSGEWECAGYEIADEERRRHLNRRNQEQDGNTDWEYTIDGGEYEELGEATGDEEISEAVDVSDTLDTAVEFSGTKLLGITSLPPDSVNYDGCTTQASTCTAVKGQVSVAYAGVNEYGVLKAVIEHLQEGMEQDTFIDTDSPAQKIEFKSAGGTAPSGVGGRIIPLNTDRGMEQPEEESPISRYGILFVCLVAVLGTCTIAALYNRHKKGKRRAKEMDEEFEVSDEDYEAHLAMQQVIESGGTQPEGDSVTISESPRAVSPVTISESPGVASQEVEISLSGSKSYEAGDNKPKVY